MPLFLEAMPPSIQGAFAQTQCQDSSCSSLCSPLEAPVVLFFIIQKALSFLMLFVLLRPTPGHFNCVIVSLSLKKIEALNLN